MIKKLKILAVALLTLSLVSIVGGCTMITQPMVSSVSSTPPPVSSEQLKKHVRYLSETVHPRNYQEDKNLNAAADYIAAHFKGLNLVVEEQVFHIDGKPYRNIIAKIGNENLNEKVLIVGAHYDSFHDTPGADDNASGVAGLLELATLLSQNPPKRPVQLIAYSVEEPPIYATDMMGSAVHARHIKESHQKVSMMISLEMIGYFSDKPNSQDFPVQFLKRLYPDQGNFISVIGRFKDSKETRKVKALMAGATDLPVYSLNAPRLIHGIDFSDHRSYWDQGIKAVMITDTAFFRNRHYHKVTDVAAILDYERMAKVVQGVYAVVKSDDI